MTERLKFRNPTLVVAILGYVYDAGEPVDWSELVDAFSSDERPYKTVENTLYDLVAFGALHRVGQPGAGRKPDTRALKETTLGRAWLDRELLPLPTDPEDPLEEAEEIAARLAGEAVLEVVHLGEGE